MSMRKFAFLALAVVAGLAVVVPAVQSQSASPPPQPAPVPSIATKFAVARTAPAAPADAVATRMQRLAVADGENPGALDIRTLQRGDIRIDTGFGAHVICVTVAAQDGSGSTSCTSAQAAIDPLKPPISVDLAADGGYRVTGLLIDGDGPSVTIAGVSGTQTKVPMTASVFTTTIAEQPGSVTWTTADGASHTQAISG